MWKDWLKNLGPAAGDVKNTLDDVFDNAPDEEAFADDKAKLGEYIAHENPLAIQHAERLLEKMSDTGKEPEPGWASTTLKFVPPAQTRFSTGLAA
jgi:hypothetical protein